MIEKERIAHIKSAVDLVALAEARGIRMKKNGKSWFGLCPFHEDKNPSFSITPVKNEWHCFGCGKGGDVIKFVELFDRVTFIEAVKRLSSDADRPGTRRTLEPGEPWTPPQEKPRLTAKLVKLFQRVIEFYQTAFGKDQRAKAYLNSRGIREAGLFSDYKIGFADGSLVNVLPYEGDTFESLVKLGILNQEGEEHFLGCVVFPLFDEHGNPSGMYGRRIPGFKGPDHLYLPGKMAGLFNRECLKTHKTIILTEAVIDSLTLIQAGIKNTIPSYGVNGLIPDHLNSLYQNQVKTVYIAFDADKAGQDAMPKVKERLGNAHIKALPVTLPYGWDVNDFFIQTENAAAHFQNLLSMADPEAPAQAWQGKPDRVLKTDYGFTLTTCGREYEVRGIVKRDSRLKATVKAIKAMGGKRNMHVDTVDFYAAKSRLFLVKGLCDLFGADEPGITADVEKLMEQAEAYTPEAEAQDGRGSGQAKCSTVKDLTSKQGRFLAQ